jgi:hypothetical protein
VLEEVKEWQNRHLEKSYAIVYLDALRVKSKQDGKSCTKSVCVALGVNFEGQKEALRRGLYILLPVSSCVSSTWSVMLPGSFPGKT